MTRSTARKGRGGLRFALTARTGQADFLDLPWEVPLQQWDHPGLVDVPRGISRHVVRFIDRAGSVYALKELPRRLAEREYRLLRALATEGVPVVDVVGVVSDRSDDAGEDLEAVLITRHLDYAMPYRALLSGGPGVWVRDRILDALVGLLVRLHLEGLFWGDCSLSNTLFRRDAGALVAYLVDAETAELHAALTDGQRTHDLEIARENITGELFDIQAVVGADAGLDPVETADSICARYQQLWSELTAEEVFGPDERYRIVERLRRVNELGFDVGEIDLVRDDGRYRLRLRPEVVEWGHHRRRLASLTGLHVEENQARRLLQDLAEFGARLADETGGQPPPAVVALRWLNEVFEPTIGRVPGELRGGRQPAELFHEILEHKYLRSQAAGVDVGLDQAAASYVEFVLRRDPGDGADPPAAGG